MDLILINNLLYYVLLGIGIGLGLTYAKFTFPFISWIKGGIENQDGELANKDLQIAYVSLLVGIVTISIFFGVSLPDALIYSAYGTLAGLYGIKEFSKKDGDSN